MAKVTLPDIGTLSNQSSAREAMNENFDLIEEGFENTLSRDGTTPNQMEADIDLNGNALLNVADPVADGDAVNKRSVGELVNEFVSQIAETLIEGTARIETFTATASQTQFELEGVPGTLLNTFVFVNGLALIPNTDYTLSDGNVIELAVGAALNDEVVIRYTDLAPADSLLRADLIAEGEAEGSALVQHLPSGDGAVVRTVQDKLRDFIHVKDFGATGISSQDATAAFQAAADALPDNGGTIYVDPQGVYKFTSMVSYNKPILWKCERGVSDISTNTNGGDAERPVIYYGGASPIEALLKQTPASVGTALWGGGVEGLNFDGFNLAEYAVHLDNCRYSTVSGKARNFTLAGLLISSLSGTTGVFSKKVHVKDWEYVYGVQAAAANSHGIRIIGNGATVPATQHKIDRVFALIKHGAAVCVEETDNCYFGTVQAVGDSGSGGGGGAATGCTVLFRNIGSTVAYNNYISYLAGEMRQENGCFGNIAEHVTSEGGGIDQVSGTAIWHGAITNYTAGSERYRSREYPLRDIINIGAGEMHGLNATFFLSKWSAGSYPDGASNTATAIIPIPVYQDGVIESVQALLGTEAAAAGNWRFTMELTVHQPDTAGLAAADVTATETIAGPAQNQFKVHTFTMSELDFTKGDTIFLSLTRLGADGADTSTTAAVLLGVRIKYRADGPAGTTALYLPTWGMP